MGLAADIGLRGAILGIERVEVLLKPLVGRDAGVDRAAGWLSQFRLVSAFMGGFFRRSVSQSKELRSIPAGSGDRGCGLRQAGIGFAVPSKAVGKHGYSLHTALPFASEHGAGLQVCDATAKVLRTLRGLLRRSR